MRWFNRRQPAPPLPQAPPPPPVAMEQWDQWAQALRSGLLRHDVYLARLLHLPHIFTLAYLPPGTTTPRPLPFDNHALNTVVLPVFTGSDALRRFVEIQQTAQPLVLQLPTASAWAYIVSLELDGVTINAGGPAALSCDMSQVVTLAEIAVKNKEQGTKNST